MDCISGGGCQDNACPQTSQHLRAIKVHDPIGVGAVLFREFGFCPFGDEISQYLRLNGLMWFVCYVERKELDGPFSNLLVASRLFIISFSGTLEATVIEHS